MHQVRMQVLWFISTSALLFSEAQASLYGESTLNHSCVLSPNILSCSSGADPTQVDTCCVETYGGLVLSTQFWDTYTGLEDQGQLLPKDSWTLHGLWPDFCNGSYTGYCDLSRQYDPDPSPATTDDGTEIPPYTGPNIGTFLEPFGKYDLLEWMNTYWIAQGQPNADFWGHEFSKHGTCYSTFDTPCYGPQYNNTPHVDVLDFFEAAVLYFRRLPTWEWLADAGITPSNATDVSYSISDIQGVLAEQYGAVPYVGCSGSRYNETEAGSGTTDNGRTALSEVWYYSHVYGRPQDGHSVPVNASGSTTSCATSVGAISYFERADGSTRLM